MTRAVEPPAEPARWGEALSGWQPDFVPALAQLRRHSPRLLALVGRRLRAGWIGWDPDRDLWQPAIPPVLVFEGGAQLELFWQGWDDLSLAWNTIDLTTRPEILGRPHEWRSSQPPPLAAVTGHVLTGWAVTGSPYFPGETDLTGAPPVDAIAGWLPQGVWMEFGDVGLHLYSADSNGMSGTPAQRADEGHTRVTRLPLPPGDAAVTWTPIRPHRTIARMHEDEDHGEPARGLDSWSIERLQAFVATQDGEVLEQARVIAESHAVHRSGEPTHRRRRWATLSLRANQRLPGDGPWHHARINSQAFALRTWVIGHLGPHPDPQWDPEVLAADTLAALTVDPEDARTISTGWRDLPTEQIGELRRQRNLTAHLATLVDLLQPGPDRSRLVTWLEVRELLP